LSTTIAEALKQASSQLTHSDSPKLDAELLLLMLLDKPRTHLFCWPDELLSEALLIDYKAAIQKRANGTPIAHLTGVREFWSRDFQVTADTLIPRPDTELLIELALENLATNPQGLIADLGTGSGIIGITLALEKPNIEVIATDMSPKALAVAQKNAQRLAAKNIHFRLSDWFAEINEKDFQLIISNPPYIADNDPHLKQGDIRFEPNSALTSGAEGLDDIEIIATEARHHLLKGGQLLLEHGYNQAENVRRILTKKGYSNIQPHTDLAGHLRATSAEWQPQ
jgi:release factor glutamine methyltransferase